MRYIELVVEAVIYAAAIVALVHSLDIVVHTLI